MYAWDAIQKSLDYIEDNLSNDLKIETLTNVAALSPYYFQRLFSRLIKKTLYEYIKLRRLAKASEVLQNREIRIVDVALDYGFSDHAGFTRAFKTAYGITPEEYRNNPVLLNHFIKPDLVLNFVTIDENVPLITDGIVVEVFRKKLDQSHIYAGILREVPMKELGGGRITGIATAGQIWDTFHREKEDIPNLLPGGNEFGVMFKGASGERCCYYLAGAEVEQATNTKGYDTFTLPCGEYAVCRFEAETFAELISSAVFKASSFLFGWMKEHNLICGDFAAEIYYDIGQEVSCMELWRPIIPSHEINEITEIWNVTDKTRKPSMETINSYVNYPLWNELCIYVEEQYKIKPIFEYSSCSMQPGWNVKYKKAGRTLCTLYPDKGSYIALIVIGERERVEAELALPSFTEYLQQLYYQTKIGMGQRWLMIHVTDKVILEDVIQCIMIRRGSKK